MTIRVSSVRRGRWVWVALVVLVLLAAYALRVWQLEAESIWHDEGWSIRAMHSPFGTSDDNTPYVYYTLGHLFLQAGVGETPFALRYPSVLIGLLTVALALRIGRRWYGPWAAGTAGGLVAASPLLWDYAQEVRAYVAVPLLALALLAVADRLLQTAPGAESRRWWVLIFGLELAGLYTHNLLVPVVVWLNVALGLAWLLKRAWPPLITWAFSQALLAAAYLPWLATQSPSGTPLNTTPRLGLNLAHDIWRGYFLPVLPQLQEAGQTPLITAGGLLFISLLAVLVVRQRDQRTWLLASHVILVPLLSALLIITAHIDFHPRYFVAAVPASLLSMAAGVVALRPLAGQRLVQPGLAVLLAGGVFISAGSLDDIARTRTYQHDDFAGLARYYASLPPEAVILIPYEREPALQDYYAERLDIQARFVNIPLYSTEAEALRHLRRLSLADGTRPVEFLTWFQLPADVRGMYPCLLTTATSEPPGDPQTFFGLATQRYDLTRTPGLEPLVARPVYEPVQFLSMGWGGSREGVCVRSRWRLVQPTEQDLQLVVDVVNAGDEVRLARSDRQLADATQLPTSQWAAGQEGSTYHLLRLPPGTPRDDYQLQLGLYSEAAPNGLPLVNAEQADSGLPATTYVLPEAVTLVGPPYTPAPEQPLLLEDNLPDGDVWDGTQPLRVTLVINNVEPNALNRVNVQLRDADGAWTIRHAARFEGSPALSWHTFSLPEDAPPGTAELVVAGQVIATYPVQPIERLFDPPDFATVSDIKFPGVGNLAGFTLPATTLTAGEPFGVELVWQANTATVRPYTVFVQLLDAEGRLLAQSDSPPVEGRRPTTQWVPGEYIIDNHRLHFQVEEYEGAATLIVGFYDPANGERVPSGAGEDAARLPVEITVEAN